MIDLAENYDNGFIPMKEVANRQNISLKYIERIMPSLTKCDLVEAVHGKGGGYRLVRTSAEYTVGEILRSAEGDLAPVACLGCDAKECENAENCKTLPMWKDYYALINDFFDGKRLSEFV